MSSSGTNSSKRRKISASKPKKKVAMTTQEEDEEEEAVDLVAIDKKETCKDNHTSCVSDEVTAVKEVFDEKTCLELLTEYYAIYKEVTLPPSTRCDISGCEFDYSSNTYRLMVTLSAGTASVGENFIIVKIDGATGFPKILSVK